MKKPTLPVMNKKNSNLHPTQNKNQTVRTKIEVTGDLKISWSEGSISWKRKRKRVMMRTSKEIAIIKIMTRNKKERLLLERVKRRKNVSICRKFIRRRKLR
jgi:hypothetical protein